ncbi:TPA: bifunctional acetate--CoA ligase family protein/GNAT family N-acetyltransferase [Aeromonas salmonicida]|uniref:bifunctional acetate--CoA ligase family protein/GNAT family N-acetyltransferase n=1 Tax=Aeromonas salmonicida TaxID=645 RepID=UPI0004471AEB|nr:bifunctional acetate--CoA ligase family protein/GNAT family N-acetyltransferase [Aeromonas salmonicida]ELI6406393.1 bifunctional acetate--CoA ligase family protein/GNAT family N-acetyltransferase [Aeromonas salmonicida subsp. salmonicida]ASI21684.1 protein acetyltransferase [Aeromonas salmonicida]ASI26000.1 protein acetyltransferase [Aeromonas salmonicida]ASI30118.1 protein acetyltransferase [Aeromonas salmonicida]ATD37154.1 protein acetyltransferase [Aeromonas salmonicida subsp. masoucida]
MKPSGLDRLFKPHSIAVIGASTDPQKAGHVVIRHLLAGQFKGPILPVSPHNKAIAGVLAYPDIASLPLSPDLAIICTKRERVLSLIEALGKKGAGAAIILAADFSQEEREQLQRLSSQYDIRLLGPNSMGMLLPAQGINASFSPIAAKPGQVAFVSQSAAVSTTILDWAKQHELGFSAFISLGDHCDIDFGQLLDQLSRDGTTRAILLYMDKLHDARHFLSAARAASRNKPILVLKSGRHDPAKGLDNVYDAAIRRAGMLRVRDTHELFAAVETLSHSLTLKGERLAIISNGRGLANMAVDVLLERGGKLAIPPKDIGSDADITAYQQALDALLQGNEADAILLIHAPSLTARGAELARSLIDYLRQHPRARRFNILTNWAGEYSAQEGRKLFTEAGIPTYRTPESAVAAFMHMVEYRRNQKQLIETPASLQGDKLNVELCQQLIRQALERKQLTLDTHLVQPILQAAGLATLPTWIVSDAIEATLTAEQIGYPVAVKLRSPDIAHKSAVHGVMLNLRTSAEVAQAADAILDRVRQHDAGARIEGLLVQRMARRSGGLELRIRLQQDPVFGPVILLGESGAEPQEMVAALPPLNQALARYQVIGALKSRKIREQATPERLDIDALGQVLCQLSELLLAFPEIQELDLHPLQACGAEMVILDASLTLMPMTQQRCPLAIRPYPTELEEGAWLKDQSHVLLRPIRPEDEPAHKQFVLKVSDEDRYKRFFADVGELGHEELARMTQIDYDREMAFVAVGQDGAFSQQILGVVRAISNPDQSDAEFAILVRSDLKGLGLGKLMMEKIVRYARERGIGQLSGMTMPSNRGMINLAKRLGFKIDIQLEDGVVNMELPCAERA